jgi:hypothetical protein
MMQNLMSTWVSTVYGTIGIAAIKDPSKGEVAIRALPIMGVDQKHDEKEIAEWGGRIPITDLKKIIALAEA